jgi:hypothetical protein
VAAVGVLAVTRKKRESQNEIVASLLPRRSRCGRNGVWYGWNIALLARMGLSGPRFYPRRFFRRLFLPPRSRIAQPAAASQGANQGATANNVSLVHALLRHIRRSRSGLPTRLVGHKAGAGAGVADGLV